MRFTFVIINAISKGAFMIVSRDKGTVIEKTSMSSPVYLNVKNEPFKIYGVKEYFRRVPKSVTLECREGVERFASNTTGVRVRFRTNSD